MELCGGFIGCVPGWMFIDPGNVGFALDGQIVLRWRFLFRLFFWPVGAALASVEIFRQARLDTKQDLHAEAISRRGAPGVLLEILALGNRGRREDRMRAAPAVSCACLQTRICT